MIEHTQAASRPVTTTIPGSQGTSFGLAGHLSRSGPPYSILLMAHGSKDPAGQAELHELETAVRHAAGSHPVAMGVLEYPGPLVPAIERAAAALASMSPRMVVAVPVLLLHAGHGKVDVPREFAGARRAFPAIDWRLAPPLMPHPSLRIVAQERWAASLDAVPVKPRVTAVAEQLRGARGAETCASVDIDEGHDSAVLLVGRGSHDAHASADLCRIARLFSEEFGHPLVEPAFVSRTTPTVAEGIGRCGALGARSVVVLPYFLHTGVLVQRICAEVAAAHALHPYLRLRLAAHLGNHPLLVQLLLLRAREASRGVRPLPCLAGVDPMPGSYAVRGVLPDRADGEIHTHAHRHDHGHTHPRGIMGDATTQRAVR